ncbi:hypothetical protein I3843_01G083700 [Carya illinoinensis]|nr:hypothetical protein I3843_01G083700 [Carya illinoinensis]
MERSSRFEYTLSPMACGSSALRIISSSAKLANLRSQYTSLPTNALIPIKLSNPSLTDIHPSLLDPLKSCNFTCTSSTSMIVEALPTYD